MAVLAKPGNGLPVIKAEKSKDFIKQFNKSNPSKSLKEACRKAGVLFGKAK